MQKRGQVTIFIIVAIIIVGAIVVLFAFRDKISFTKGEIIIDPEVRPIYDFIRACVKETGYKAAVKNGRYGGYYILPKRITEGGIPYYFDNGQNYMPTKEELERQLSLYMEDNLRYCFLDFLDFPNYKISGREVKAKIEINENKIIIDIIYPISIRKGEAVNLLEEFRDNEILIRTGLMYDIATQLIDLQSKDPSKFCLNCFKYIGDQNNMAITVFENEDKFIFQIVDLSEVEEEPYQFIFAYRYNIK